MWNVESLVRGASPFIESFMKQIPGMSSMQPNEIW